MPEKANSVRFVWPTSAAPAARRRATAGQSAVAGGRSASTTEPAVVGCPATSNRSFTLTARPASGGSGAPARRCASTHAATAAEPSKRRMKAWRSAGLSAAACDASCSSALRRRPEAMSSRVEIRSLRSGVMVLLYFAGLPRGA